MMMPGIVVEEPHSAEDFIEASNRAIAHGGPTYIRIHKLEVPWSLRAVVRRDGFEVVRLRRDGNGTIITCGMVTPEVMKAVERLGSVGKQYTLISIHTLSGVSGFGKWVTPGRPVFAFYNGAPRVLESIIYKEVFGGMTDLPSGVLVRGFEMGVTGSIDELFRHFGLDADSIVDLCS